MNKEGQTTAIVSYITIVGTIIAIFMNLEPKNDFARHHIRQAFGINIMFYALGFMVSFLDSFYATSAFYLFCIVLWSYGFAGAVQYKKYEIPILGKYFLKWFTFIQ